MGVHVVGGETLEIADRHGLIDVLAVALLLARVMTDTPANRRHGAALADQFVSFGKLADRDQRDIALGVDARGTRTAARRGAGGLGDAEEIRDGLRVRPEDRLAGAQFAVELVGEVDGAHFGALAAGVALARIHVPRPPPDPDLELPGLPADPLHIGHRDDFDILVAGALDEFRRKDAHGAVAGGEGLIQCGHAAADGG